MTLTHSERQTDKADVDYRAAYFVAKNNSMDGRTDKWTDGLIREHVQKKKVPTGHGSPNHLS